MRAALRGPELTVDTVARRLRHHGWHEVAGERADLTLERATSTGADPGLIDCEVSWFGPSSFPAERPGSEATVQARCGLMHLHGTDRGVPRRLGIEVASIAAGLLATHGILAAALAHRRGRDASRVTTSVLQAGLTMVSHYVAVATTGPGDWSPPAEQPAPGPPFATADNRWFEIETLDPEAWKAFWSKLAVPPGDQGRGWGLFRLRYQLGRCSLPASLHQATRRRTLGELTALAEECAVSLCRLRGPAEVLVTPDLPDGHPAVHRAGHTCGTPTARAPAQLPLEGIRVVESTSRIQGPLAGQLLRMLGADVVLVEPEGGDLGRMMPPYAGQNGALFTCHNRGKDSIELNLKRPAGRRALLDLISKADIFLHNWRPGRAEDWELGCDVLARRNPQLVYAHACGWGELGQRLGLLGTDFLVQAYTGLGAALNPEGEPPFPSRLALTDYLGALVTCEGILAALDRRDQEGGSYKVDGSLIAGAMTLHSPLLRAFATGTETTRHATRPVWGPLDHPLHTQHGWLVVSAADALTLRRLAHALDLAPDTMQRHAVEPLLVERLRANTARHWERVLTGAGVPAAVVCTDLATVADDPHLSPLLTTLPGGGRAPAPPWRFA